MMKFLNQTQEDVLTLQADGSNTLEWHADAAFAVHPDFKSHTGATMSMGRGVVTHLSKKQSLNTRSSTEAEVVAADDVVGPMLWTKRFLEAQGYPVKDNILFQDN
jgi:aspartyl aminopeptidase